MSYVALFERLGGQPLAELRVIRAWVEERVMHIVHDRIDEIRHDRTAREFRVIRLLPQLVSEFEGWRSPEEIRACADATSRATTTSGCAAR